MDIIWHGKSCFTLKGKTATLVMNPDDSIKTPLKGDVVISSLGDDAKLAEVKDVRKTFTWPGEYEVSGVVIAALPAWTRSKSKEESGEKGEETLIFCIEIEGVSLCHLGGLGHKLTSEMVDEIGDVDVLFVSVGKESNLGDKAEEVVGQIDPRVVILMGDEHPEAYAKDLKAQLGEKLDKYTITSVGKLPQEKTEYYVLTKV